MIFKKIKPLLVLIVFIYTHSVVFAQISNLPNTVTGKPLREGGSYVDVNGSPYLDDNWTKGDLSLKTGESFSSINIKYNLLEDQLIYLKEDEPYYLDKNIALNFTYLGKDLREKKIQNGFQGIPDYSPRNYFIVLYEEGPILLLKKIKSIINSSQFSQLGSSTLVKSFEQKTEYFLVLNDQVYSTRMKKKDLKEFLDIDNAKIKKWLDTQKNKLREEEDLLDLLETFGQKLIM